MHRSHWGRSSLHFFFFSLLHCTSDSGLGVDLEENAYQCTQPKETKFSVSPQSCHVRVHHEGGDERGTAYQLWTGVLVFWLAPVYGTATCLKIAETD